MRALVVVVVILGVFAGIYTAAMAAWSYIQLTSVIQDAVPRELAKSTESTFASDRDGRVRAAVVKDAAQAGVALDPSAVAISEEGGALWVRVTHLYPVARLGDHVFTIPLSMARSFPLTR